MCPECNKEECIDFDVCRLAILDKKNKEREARKERIRILDLRQENLPTLTASFGDMFKINLQKKKK